MVRSRGRNMPVPARGGEGVGDFALHPQGRPCGRPPAALGRQRKAGHQRPASWTAAKRKQARRPHRMAGQAACSRELTGSSHARYSLRRVPPESSSCLGLPVTAPGPRHTTVGRTGGRRPITLSLKLMVIASFRPRVGATHMLALFGHRLPPLLRRVVNEAGGRRGRSSPSGRAGDHRRQARAQFVLAGRALRVPVSVSDGPPRTTTVTRQTR